MLRGYAFGCLLWLLLLTPLCTQLEEFPFAFVCVLAKCLHLFETRDGYSMLEFFVLPPFWYYFMFGCFKFLANFGINFF